MYPSALLECHFSLPTTVLTTPSRMSLFFLQVVQSHRANGKYVDATGGHAVTVNVLFPNRTVFVEVVQFASILFAN